jgi:regulator of nonsense transcripts 1
MYMKTLQKPYDLDGFDEEAIQILLSMDKIAMSEFEFILLTHKWCQKFGQPLESFLSLFDFNVLKPEEKAWVLAQLPVSKDTPALVLNALCSSNILSREELAHFQLDYPGIRWKCVYDSAIDRLGTFLDAASTNMGIFHRTMLVFQIHERLSIAVYVPKAIDASQNCLVDNTCRLFAFPHTQGRERQSRLALPTKMNYRLYCDGELFQLFENRTSNSWVYIARPGSRAGEQNGQNKGKQRRQRQEDIDRGTQVEICTSIALDKFSQNLARHIGGVVNRSPISAAVSWRTDDAVE